jgi:hypothetical protein
MTLSAIDSALTDRERRVLAAYRSPAAATLRRPARLAAGYALGAGILTWLAVAGREPRYALAVYGVLLAALALRLVAARRVAGVVPGVIEKYEGEIARLRGVREDRRPVAGDEGGSR